MKVILFRSRLREGVDVDAYTSHAARIYELATQMPGFVSAEDFSGADGEQLAVVVFKDDETLKRWRDHPEHREAQAVGRDVYYQRYSIQVCDVERSYASR